MQVPPIEQQLKRLLALNQGFQNRLLPTTAWNIGQQLLGCDDKALRQTSQKLQEPPLQYQHLRQFLRFRRRFPHREQISNRLFWTHYQILSRLPDESARLYYHERAIKEQWSCRELQRQIKARHYERAAQNGKPAPNHLVLEFTDLQAPYSEACLEASLIEKLQWLLLELGDGWAFVARQKRLVTESGKAFYVDLVFYHLYLRCFVLLELKVGELSHRDIGQIDSYVRYFDQHFRLPGDAPTVGLILCRQQDHTLVRYSMLHGHPRLWSATYQLHLPSEEEWAAWSQFTPSAEAQ
ncbi:MAG: DUF1016 family protein [Bacteroidetes bacterium]|jgi:predicted nuclease of restriction endonuclease-like (RecB) superfamily|nr:DUF1016 family protein [Bacteroidota bacterium]